VGVFALYVIDPFKTLVPPYSSLYFGSDTLMSDETVWVIDFYRKLGLKPDKDQRLCLTSQK
jgi:hypothetical protein